MVVQKSRFRKERGGAQQRYNSRLAPEPHAASNLRLDVRAADIRLIQPMGALTENEWSLQADRQAARREAIRSDISRRLRRICSHYTDEQFTDLIETMTERQLHSERRIIRFPE